MNSKAFALSSTAQMHGNTATSTHCGLQSDTKYEFASLCLRRSEIAGLGRMTWSIFGSEGNGAAATFSSKNSPSNYTGRTGTRMQQWRRSPSPQRWTYWRWLKRGNEEKGLWWISSGSVSKHGHSTCGAFRWTCSRRSVLMPKKNVAIVESDIRIIAGVKKPQAFDGQKPSTVLHTIEQFLIWQRRGKGAIKSISMGKKSWTVQLTEQRIINSLRCCSGAIIII